MRPIKAAVACLGSGHFAVKSNPQVGALQAAVLNGHEGIRVRSSIYDRLRIGITFQYVVVTAEGERGPYRCSIRAYIFDIKTDGQADIINYHWHPLSLVSSDLKPHMHVGEAFIKQTGKLHVPTPRLSAEQALMAAIDSFGAIPKVDDWRSTMEDSHSVHVEWRDWHDRSDAPESFPGH